MNLERSKTVESEFVYPSKESIKNAVIAAGGVREVADVLHKTPRAVQRWIDGSRRMDFANWTQLCIVANSNYKQ